jgi:hypothetical protein
MKRYPINSVIKKEKELYELTMQYLKDFQKMNGNREGSTSYMGEVLAKALMDFDNCEQDTFMPMLSMASLDTNLTKAMVTQRMQGFVDIIERKISTPLSEQDDYYIEDVAERFEEIQVERSNIAYILRKEGEPTKIVTEKLRYVSFKVRNSRSGFEGSVIMKYEWEPVFINENDCYHTWILDDIQFFVGKNRVMVIDYETDWNKDGNATRLGYEEVTIDHFKYVADINSFYITICCV